jgi:hypothetical protein
MSNIGYHPILDTSRPRRFPPEVCKSKFTQKVAKGLDNIDLINYIITVSPPRYIKLFKGVYYEP